MKKIMKLSKRLSGVEDIKEEEKEKPTTQVQQDKENTDFTHSSEVNVGNIELGNIGLLVFFLVPATHTSPIKNYDC